MPLHFSSSESDNFKQLKEWKEKLTFYEKELPKVSINEKYSVTKIIQECEQNIQDLESRIKNSISQRMDEEDQINPLNNASDQEKHNHNSVYVEKELARFNFNPTIDTIEKVIERFQRNNGTALFLLQNSISMGGEYFSVRFREVLRTQTKEGSFRHRLIEFTEICPAQKIEILNKFYKYFPTDYTFKSTDEYTNQIIETICESIPHSGFILFLELSGLEYLLEKEKIIPWFVKDFWHSLSTKLKSKLSRKGYKKVRVICLMKTDDNLPNDCLPSCIYKLLGFNSSEVHELAIELCSREEIEDFLYTFGGFNDEKVKQLVQLIYRTSNGGNPNLVCGRLKKILTQVN